MPELPDWLWIQNVIFPLVGMGMGALFMFGVYRVAIRWIDRRHERLMAERGSGGGAGVAGARHQGRAREPIPVRTCLGGDGHDYGDRRRHRAGRAPLPGPAAQGGPGRSPVRCAGGAGGAAGAISRAAGSSAAGARYRGGTGLYRTPPDAGQTGSFGGRARAGTMNGYEFALSLAAMGMITGLILSVVRTVGRYLEHRQPAGGRELANLSADVDALRTEVAEQLDTRQRLLDPA